MIMDDLIPKVKDFLAIPGTYTTKSSKNLDMPASVNPANLRAGWLKIVA